MALTGKILSMVAAVLTFLGTFVFSLMTAYPGMFDGINIIRGLIPAFQALPSLTAMSWVIVIGLILYLLSFIIQLVGMKSRIAAAFGSIFPIAMTVIMFLFYFGVIWFDFSNLLTFFFFTDGLLPPYLPITLGFFGVGLEVPWQAGLYIDLGTFFVGAGGLLSLVSVFFTRKD